ncbi:MAG: glutaminyl-peptide cyclotransferase, partial [Bacteroidota bacterium]
MGLIKFFSCSILIFFLACGGESNPRNLFDIQIEGNKKQLQQGESVAVSIQNKKGKSIDKVSYFVDGQELAVQSGKLLLYIEKLGNKLLEAKV